MKRIKIKVGKHFVSLEDFIKSVIENTENDTVYFKIPKKKGHEVMSVNVLRSRARLTN